MLAAGGPRTSASRAKRSLTRGFSPRLGLLLYVAFIAAAIYFIPQILSWALDTPHPMAAVTSQSMWPTLKEGDLVFLKGVDKAEDLRIGDIIAFEHPEGITLHRVTEIKGDFITTKGDANPIADKPVHFDRVVGRVIKVGGGLARVPYLGGIVGFFGLGTAETGQPWDERQVGPTPDKGIAAMP